jgi:hypothetical protein
MAVGCQRRNQSASHHFAVRQSGLRRESVNATKCGGWMSKVAVADMPFACRQLIYTRILLAKASHTVNWARPV